MLNKNVSTQISSLNRANIHLINFVFRLLSSKRPEKLEMPDRIKSQDMHSGFKGELIENELVCDILEDSNTALKYPSK